MEGLRGTWLTASSEWEQALFMMLLPWMPLGVLAVLPANSEEVREGTTKQLQVSSPVLESVWDILGDFFFPNDIV